MAELPNRCAVPGCPCTVKRGLLMCLAHWRLVPRALQTAVNRTWRNFCSARGVGAELRGKALDDYREARARAIAAVRREEALDAGVPGEAAHG
ncbi:hypothetical protein [Azospirillum halopraeferens]|uniref:hypothetical protein n=1 Tax=Azospirillum halopraeferens TaxID=34010 RepID=UPI000491718C|nr:hypothetical protein [Azospirillum halopraeferens]